MKRFKRILCEAGVGEVRTRVLKCAVDLAEKNQAELTVIDIIEPWPKAWGERETPQLRKSVQHARQKRLEHALLPFRKRMAIDARSVNVSNMPFLTLVREVLRGGHDLVIRESENPDWIDCKLGSDDMQLLRACPCPVWLLDPSAKGQSHRILVAVDVDRQYPAHELGTRHALNLLALELACSQAIADKAELHVVHAWQEPSSTATYPGMPAGLVTEHIKRTRADHELELARLLQETTDYIGSQAMQLIKRHDHMLDGSPRRVVPKLARKLATDLVVMGSVARTGIKGLLVGNTAEAILAQLDCSVLVVKPPGFVTPVSLDD